MAAEVVTWENFEEAVGLARWAVLQLHKIHGVPQEDVEDVARNAVVRNLGKPLWQTRYAVVDEMRAQWGDARTGQSRGHSPTVRSTLEDHQWEALPYGSADLVERIDAKREVEAMHPIARWALIQRANGHHAARTELCRRLGITQQALALMRRQPRMSPAMCRRYGEAMGEGWTEILLDFFDHPLDG